MGDTVPDPFGEMGMAAVQLHEWFLTLLQGGFTETQALMLIAYTIDAGAFRKNKKEKRGGGAP